MDSQRTLLATVEDLLCLGDVGDSILFPGRSAVHFGNVCVLWWVLRPYGSFELQCQWGGLTFLWFHMVCSEK